MEELMDIIESNQNLLLAVKFKFNRWHVDIFKTDADRRGQSMTMQIAHANSENREESIKECLKRYELWRKYHDDEDRSM